MNKFLDSVTSSTWIWIPTLVTSSSAENPSQIYEFKTQVGPNWRMVWQESIVNNGPYLRELGSIDSTSQDLFLITLKLRTWNALPVRDTDELCGVFIKFSYFLFEIRPQIKMMGVMSSCSAVTSTRFSVTFSAFSALRTAV